MSYKALQSAGMSELDRIRSQSSTDWLAYERAEGWLRRVLPDLEAEDHLAAVRFVVDLKRARGLVTKADVQRVLGQWRVDRAARGWR